MSDLNHVLFTLISFIAIGILLYLAHRYVDDGAVKDRILKTSAVITVIIHYSSLYYDYFTAGYAEIENNMILPVYPCNIAMWALVICAFIKNRDGMFFKIIAEATFYLGTVGGIIGIVFNEAYISTPDFRDFNVLKGMLSHVTMLFGSIYLLVGKYIKIRVDNMISAVAGLAFMVVDGAILIFLFKKFGIDPPNIMFLLENPFPELPWFNTLTIGILAILLVFTVTALVERFLLPSEERWYTKIKNYLENRRVTRQ